MAVFKHASGFIDAVNATMPFKSLLKIFLLIYTIEKEFTQRPRSDKI